MSIIFFSSDSCGYCQKAKSLLANDIQAGRIVVKGPSEAPKGVTGYPHFVNMANNKSHTGCPSSASELFQKLGASGHEGFSGRQQRMPEQPPRGPAGRYRTLNTVCGGSNEGYDGDMTEWFVGVL